MKMVRNTVVILITLCFVLSSQSAFATNCSREYLRDLLEMLESVESELSHLRIEYQTSLELLRERTSTIVEVQTARLRQLHELYERQQNACENGNREACEQATETRTRLARRQQFLQSIPAHAARVANIYGERVEEAGSVLLREKRRIVEAIESCRNR